MYMTYFDHSYSLSPLTSSQEPTHTPTHPPNSCPLFNNSLGLISATHTHMGMEPSPVAWSTYQKPHPKRKMALPVLTDFHFDAKRHPPSKTPNNFLLCTYHSFCLYQHGLF